MTTREPPKAGETYRYAVTSADIEAGMTGDPLLCPVARAIQRRHGLPNYRITVGHNAFYLSGPTYKTTRHAPLPQRVAGFISDFDSEREVKPMQFSLTWYLSP